MFARALAEFENVIDCDGCSTFAIKKYASSGLQIITCTRKYGLRFIQQIAGEK